MSLHYKYLPSLSSAEKKPVLILLHGRGTDENDLIGLAPYFESSFHIYSVRAPFPFEFGGYMWCDIDDSGTINTSQLVESRALLERFIQSVQHLPDVDGRRIFLFGFSLGALMALDVGISGNIGQTVIVAHSGFYAGSEDDIQKKEKSTVQIFLAHGSYDPVVPVEMARQSYQLFQRYNLPVVFREYPIEHTISEDSLMESIQWLREHLG